MIPRSAFGFFYLIITQCIFVTVREERSEAPAGDREVVLPNCGSCFAILSPPSRAFFAPDGTESGLPSHFSEQGWRRGKEEGFCGAPRPGENGVIGRR